MLATGATMTAVLHDIISRGGSTEYIRVLSIIAAAPALKLLSEEFKGAPLLEEQQARVCPLCPCCSVLVNSLISSV